MLRSIYSVYVDVCFQARGASRRSILVKTSWIREIAVFREAALIGRFSKGWL